MVVSVFFLGGGQEMLAVCKSFALTNVPTADWICFGFFFHLTFQGARLIFHVAFLAMLTLVVNGISSGPLLRVGEWVVGCKASQS